MLEIVNVKGPTAYADDADARPEVRVGLPEGVELLGAREAVVLGSATDIADAGSCAVGLLERWFDVEAGVEAGDGGRGG